MQKIEEISVKIKDSSDLMITDVIEGAIQTEFLSENIKKITIVVVAREMYYFILDDEIIFTRE